MRWRIVANGAGQIGHNSEDGWGIFSAESCYFWGGQRHFQVEIAMATFYYGNNRGDSSEIAIIRGGASFLRVTFDYREVQD